MPMAKQRGRPKGSKNKVKKGVAIAPKTEEKVETKAEATAETPSQQ